MSQERVICAAERWIDLRATRRSKALFAIVPLGTEVTNGPGSRAARIAMAYKLSDAGQDRWLAADAVCCLNICATIYRRKPRRPASLRGRTDVTFGVVRNTSPGHSRKVLMAAA